MGVTKSPPNLGKRLVALFTAAGLALVTLVTGVVAAPEAKAAGSPLSCSPDVIYGQTNQGIVQEFNVKQSMSKGDQVAKGQRGNGLAISSDGQYVFTVDNSTSSDKYVRMWDVVADKLVEDVKLTGFGSGNRTYLFKGAVDPATGWYYFAGYEAVGAYVLSVVGFDGGGVFGFGGGW